MATTMKSGAQSKAKGRQHRKKQGYYEQQKMVTLKNKATRNAKRVRGMKRKQVDSFMKGRAIRRAKQFSKPTTTL